jgi:dipeptidyl aminopeptidase/acylaminoacyl peptidase
MPDGTLDGGDPVSRSWDELLAHARRRGTTLRRRRRLLLASPVAGAALAVGLALVTVGDRREDSRIDVVDAGPGGADGPTTTTVPSAADLPRLVFARVLDGGAGGSAIFVVDADGNGLEQLTPDPAWREGSPAWSPDGRWIAFDSQRDNALAAVGKSVSDVYVMRPDGSDVHRVTRTDAPGDGSGVRQPAWSPGGEQLAVAAEDAEDESRIVVVAPDGSGALAITPGPGDVFPAWSPDGAWIAFQRDGFEIWVVRPDGSGLRRVTTADGPTRIAWTPDSARLSFEVRSPEGGTEVVSVQAADGAGRTVVAAGVEPYAGDAAWTSGGAVVAYTSDPDGPYRVDPSEQVREGGPLPAAIVLARPGGPVLGIVTRPAAGEADVNAGFAPPAAT